MINTDKMIFADEPKFAPTDLNTWKVMVVDDEEGVHSATKIALNGFTFEGRRLQFIDAYSGVQARNLIRENPDTALILLDVIMEKSDSGFQVVRHIREDLHNNFVRIVLRTGQPGQTPEEQIFLNYNINDYKAKSELTFDKLFTTVLSSLRSYKDIKTLEQEINIRIQKEQELNIYRNTLEDMVENRTKALTSANAQLKQEIQERKAVEKKLIEAKDAADKANQDKSEFLNTVSHELRTPLTSILGFSSMIKENLEQKIFPVIEKTENSLSTAISNMKEELDIIVSEAERLTTMINEVLDLAKIESGKVVWVDEEIEIIDVISHAVNAIKILSDNKGLKVKTNIEAEHVHIIGDKNKLIQVVTNLLSNAIKFTDSGEINITIKNQDEYIRCEIKDSGCGIPKDSIDSVFEKFKQVTDTLSKNQKGTGLGLPICREIIAHYGGKIWVESEYGFGSTFIFYLCRNDHSHYGT